MTVLRCLRVKPRKRGLNRPLKPVLQGGGTGSHTLPNHVIGTVNTTFAKGHHAQTWRTTRNFLMFQTIAVHQIKLYIIIFDWGRQYSLV